MNLLDYGGWIWSAQKKNRWGAWWLNGIVSCELKRRGPAVQGQRCRFTHPEFTRIVWFYLCQGLNSHYFHIIGDGHQPNSRGLYTHYKDSQYRDFDHGTFSCILFAWLNFTELHVWFVSPAPQCFIGTCLVWLDALHVRMWTFLRCPSLLCCKLMIRKQRLYPIFAFFGSFFKSFKVSFACGVFETRWNPPSVYLLFDHATSPQMKEEGFSITCNLSVKNFLVGKSLFLGTLSNGHARVPTQLGRVMTSRATWCHVFVASWRMYFDWNISYWFLLYLYTRWQIPLKSPGKVKILKSSSNDTIIENC